MMCGQRRGLIPDWVRFCRALSPSVLDRERPSIAGYAIACVWANYPTGYVQAHRAPPHGTKINESRYLVHAANTTYLPRVCQHRTSNCVRSNANPLRDILDREPDLRSLHPLPHFGTRSTLLIYRCLVSQRDRVPGTPRSMDNSGTQMDAHG